MHVHDPKCIYTGKYIGVSRNEYKLHVIFLIQKTRHENFWLTPS